MKRVRNDVFAKKRFKLDTFFVGDNKLSGKSQLIYGGVYV